MLAAKVNHRVYGPDSPVNQADIFTGRLFISGPLYMAVVLQYGSTFYTDASTGTMSRRLHPSPSVPSCQAALFRASYGRLIGFCRASDTRTRSNGRPRHSFVHIYPFRVAERASDAKSREWRVRS